MISSRVVRPSVLAPTRRRARIHPLPRRHSTPTT